MLHDLLGEDIVLLGGGELAEEGEEGHLQEVGPLSQHLNRVAPVLKDAPVSIDEADLRRASDRVHVPRIVAPQNLAPERQLAQVIGSDVGILDGDLGGLPCPRVRDR